MLNSFTTFLKVSNPIKITLLQGNTGDIKNKRNPTLLLSQMGGKKSKKSIDAINQLKHNLNEGINYDENK